jgi:hypothetical protein
LASASSLAHEGMRLTASLFIMAIADLIIRDSLRFAKEIAAQKEGQRATIAFV